MKRQPYHQVAIWPKRYSKCLTQWSKVTWPTALVMVVPCAMYRTIKEVGVPYLATPATESASFPGRMAEVAHTW